MTSAKRWEDEARGNLASVEGEFAGQPTDNAWAASTRQALHDRLTSRARSSSSSLRSIECRSSICRVEVVHQDAAASQQFGERAFTDADERAWNGPVVITPPQANPDGSLVMVMYLGREGTSLLKPER